MGIPTYNLCMNINARQLAKATLFSLVVPLLLSGCWTPPRADIQPPGPSRVIQRGIVVNSTLRRAIVQSVDAQARTIVLEVPGTPGVHSYRAGQQVSDLDRLHAGAMVRATVSEELTVYVSSDGGLPGADGAPGGMGPTARILSLDPSYRVLTLQETGGQTEDFKVGLEVRLGEMQAGDQVLIQAPEIVSLSVR